MDVGREFGGLGYMSVCCWVLRGEGGWGLDMENSWLRVYI